MARFGDFLPYLSNMGIIAFASGAIIFLPVGIGEWKRNCMVQLMQCNYPGCKDFSYQVCLKCHKSFCTTHVRKRGKKYICEFCTLVEAAQGSSQKRFKRIAYIVCGLISLFGLILLMLGQNAPGIVFFIGGFFSMAGVARTGRLPRPSRM